MEPVDGEVDPAGHLEKALTTSTVTKTKKQKKSPTIQNILMEITAHALYPTFKIIIILPSIALNLEL